VEYLQVQLCEVSAYHVFISVCKCSINCFICVYGNFCGELKLNDKIKSSVLASGSGRLFKLLSYMKSFPLLSLGYFDRETEMEML
jgi:hypothetical protein